MIGKLTSIYLNIDDTISFSKSVLAHEKEFDMAVRILIGNKDVQIGKQLAIFLQENGFSVVGEAQEGNELLRKVHTIYPDLVILDYQMKGLSGKQVAEVLVNDEICPVIAIVNQSEIEYFGLLLQNFNFSYVIKPLNKRLLLQTIHLLIKANRKVKKLEKQVEHLKQKLDTKEEIDKAKALLMKYMHMTEEEAHRKIQKQSMDRGISKLEVAKAIILTYDI
jgi:response regulator NasT